MRRFLRGFLLLALMLAASGAGFGSGTAQIAGAATALQPTGTIEVHARMCDEVPVDGDWFNSCHDSLAVDVWFDAIETGSNAVESGTTNASGNITFTLPAGTWQLSGPPGDFLQATFIFCSTGPNTPQVAHPVVLTAGSAVICDYYFVPDDLSGLGSIEVHARMCDEVPANGDWFNSCHDDIAPNVFFDATETTTNENVNATTNASGNLVFQLPPGTWRLSGPPGDFLEETFIYCSTGANTPQVPHPVTLGAGDAVICDYYFVPDDSSGPPTPTVAPTAVPPTPAPTAVPRPAVLELPVVLVAGSCENVRNATEVTELSDAVILQGNARGSVDAIQAAVGYTQVSRSLDTLLGSNHVIAVLDTDGQTVVACGAIGGVPDGQGAFTIGIAPVDDSGVAGTAYLASRGASATGISVFIVPDGLMPDPVLQPIG